MSRRLSKCWLMLLVFLLNIVIWAPQAHAQEQTAEQKTEGAVPPIRNDVVIRGGTC